MLHDDLGSNTMHTGIVATTACLLSVDAAWAAVEGYLDGILRTLVPAHETSERMGGSPDAHHRGGDKGGKVHICRIHREHHLQMAHQDKLLPDGFQTGCHMDTLRVFRTPLGEDLVLTFALAEKEQSCLRMLLRQLGDHLFHQLQRVYLPLVFRKGSDTDVEWRAERGELRVVWQQTQVTTTLWEDGVEVQLYGETQTLQHVSIVLEGGGLLDELLVIGSCQPVATLAVLVDMCHLVTAEVEAHAQEFRAQHVMQVGNMRELLGGKPAVEGVQSLDAMVLPLQVSLHKADVRGEVLKERTCEAAAQHGHPHVRILTSQGIDYGNGHGDISQGREADDEDVVFLHFTLLLYKTGLVAGSLYIFI